MTVAYGRVWVANSIGNDKSVSNGDNNKGHIYSAIFLCLGTEINSYISSNL